MTVDRLKVLPDLILWRKRKSIGWFMTKDVENRLVYKFCSCHSTFFFSSISYLYSKKTTSKRFKGTSFLKN